LENRPICSPQSVIAKHPAHDHLLKVQYLLGSFGNLTCSRFGSSGYPVLSSGAMRLVLRRRITSRLRPGRRTAYGADSRATKNQLSLNFLHRLRFLQSSQRLGIFLWDFSTNLLINLLGFVTKVLQGPFEIVFVRRFSERIRASRIRVDADIQHGRRGTRSPCLIRCWPSSS
jgi:hypothetical protein